MIGIDLHFAALKLEAGKLVAVPTETVYGLAGNALNTKAIEEIFNVKNRPHFDPLILHIGNLNQIEQFTSVIPDTFYKLAEAFSPGPITYVLKKNQQISDLVTAGKETVAIRIPAHPMLQDLLSMVDFPLAAPSANPFGYVSPTTAQHVAAQLGDKISYIVDGGPCSIGIESTIIDLSKERPVLLRQGKVTKEEIQKIIPTVEVHQGASDTPDAPGMLKSHYAPDKPVYLGNIKKLMSKFANHRLGILSFQQEYDVDNSLQSIHYILSSTGDLNKAAHNLYQYLRELDHAPVDVILCEPVPEVGIGVAINDRLRKASYKRKPI